jgi:hypothetical protein
MTGALACVALALVFDLLLIGVTWIVMPWARRRSRA